MRTPVVVTRTRSLTQADLLVGHLRSQGIEAVARTHLDRTTYAGLGGAAILVDAEKRIDAEFELMLLGSAEESADDEEILPPAGREDEPQASQESDPARPSAIGDRSWVRVCGYLVVASMVVGTVVPSVAAVWSSLAG